jgi:serine/threonine protein kinase
MGTPDYLSPEQSRSLHLTDIRTDIYSLGCTFYFLLTGEVPFPGGTALDKLIRHNTERPTAVPKFRQDVPTPVLVIMEKMIAKRPEDRFQTPAEVAEALRPYAVSGPTPWAPPKPATLGGVASAPTGGVTPPGSDAEIPIDGSDEDLLALSRTMPSTLDETPRPESPSRLYRRREDDPNERLKIAILIAISLVAGLIAAVSLAAVLSR